MYLNCKTYYSLRYGTFATKELVETAVNVGATAVALTNINCTTDAWDFVLECKKQGIKPILGAEIRNGDKLLYLLIAANNRGFAWINKFISDHLLENKSFPEVANEDPFFTDTWDGYVIYPINNKPPEKLFANEVIGVTPFEVSKLYGFNTLQQKEKFVVRQPVTFQSKGYYNVHKLLRCIDNNCLLSKLSNETVCSPNEFFYSPSEILNAFKQYPSIVTNTYKVMDCCSIEMDFGKVKNKKVFSASIEDDRALLSKLAYDGMVKRYGAKNKKAIERVGKELEIISNLEFNSYFLFTWDIIKYGQSKGYYHVGRGSGANSIVAYCLQITDVDPIDLNLYFERFLNPHRAVPPDFDIDFSWTDRDDVIDYVFKRYGKNQVALLGSHTTFQYNAIIRELGKVYGLPKFEIDELVEKGYYNGDTRGENFMKKKNEDEIKKRILQYGKFIENFPNNLSIHAGGILISEEPIYTYTALFMPPKGFATTQIDMYVAEDIGLHKVDILSQRGLGHIKSSLSLIKLNRGVDIDIHQVQKFKKDEQIREHLRNGNTIGCFYIESPATRHVMKKLRCEDYETLVAASSIIRPGVGRSGMMKEYIFRHNNPTKFQYLHPKLEEILGDTYGVMVYQEDVIKVAHYWAGLEMADADLLRRATSFKNRARDRVHVLKETFFSNCNRFGYPTEVSQEVWRQIESFGSFSFCKAHSASFAVESYQSLYLKTYFPMEFMVGVINNFGGFYSTELYFYELMRSGAKVFPPCVNNSEYLTNIKGNEVYVGFVHVLELEQVLAENIIEQRQKFGKYQHLQDFIERTEITSKQLSILIRVGALRFTEKNKKQLLWEGDFLQKKNKNHIPSSKSLFNESPKKFSLPELPIYPLDDTYDEVQLLGFPVCNPFKLADDDPTKYLPASQLKDNVGKIITVLGYHITQKPVRTIHGETMSFGTFIDVHKDWIDSVHFPEVYKQAPPKSGFYKITGKVIEEFGVFSIEVTQIEKIGIKQRNVEETVI
jgi:error-prone DNA polymerase